MLWNHLVIFYEIGNERISLLLANERFLFAALLRNFQYPNDELAEFLFACKRRYEAYEWAEKAGEYDFAQIALGY